MVPVRGGKKHPHPAWCMAHGILFRFLRSPKPVYSHADSEIGEDRYICATSANLPKPQIDHLKSYDRAGGAVGIDTDGDQTLSRWTNSPTATRIRVLHERRNTSGRTANYDPSPMIKV